ncbi:MAG: FmdB family transcriptional regulator [Actinomycetota bacterium]|nr:FmdB family transcriptional regulator [Actinomycetota bacterium]
MPTYEYACQSCGSHIEVYQRFSDEPKRECGVCGGPLRKVFHPAGILFKGSGFYATDSRAAAKSEAGDGAVDSAAEKAKTGSKEKPKEGAGSGGSKETSASSSTSSKEKSA